ncbi:N(4)-(beta-N-acetylglucosaminyl)-L-asparaginase [Radicibacter daui]|uniref:N(4)-(beta-N-acetylglucosaminyl)-L-asparaginase n=1 Tax=Radicibacter daui TaxID=3064829 RepID=UPI004046BD47
MILLANSEAWPGINQSAEALARGENGLDALVEGISRVEREVTVRSVGYGGWPNMLGVMEFDAGVMDGNTRETGAVGALRDVIPAAQVAREVMRRLPHTLLTGDGARRFALEIGLKPEETLIEDSRKVWWERLEKELSPEDLKRFPELPLASLSRSVTDPERVRDTTVFLGQDKAGGIHSATSTSGWAWKYPGRLGDSPIAGAGFYADSRYGAAACTHTGEMTVRCGTARTVVLAMKLGYSLADAVKLAIDELAELKGGFLAGVVLHAIDAHGNHEVVNFRCPGEIAYWIWQPSMSAPERHMAKIIK